MTTASPYLIEDRSVQWFRDTAEVQPFINETAVRIRAGFLLFIPLFMAFTLWSVLFGTAWDVTGNVVRDTYDTDFDGRILYMVEAVRRTYDYTVQTGLLFYVLFEMLAGMSVITARLSPTIWLAAWLAKRAPAVWKPLAPKRFAWAIGSTMVCICLVFFHPEKFAGALNWVTQTALLPTTEQYLPRWLPLVMVTACFSFMWLETVFGYCLGCHVHALLVKAGVFDDPCEACQNLDLRASHHG